MKNLILNALDVIKKPIVMGGLFLLLVALLWGLVYSKRKTPPEKPMDAKLPLVKGNNEQLKESPLTEIARNFTPWRPTPDSHKKSEAPVVPQPTPAEPLPRLIHDYEVVQKAPSKEKPKSITAPAPTIPFGRVIACQMSQAVLCGKTAVPVIARLLQPVRDAKGREFIPRGTMIHGSVQTGSLPGRIESAGEWIFVLPGQKLYQTKASLQDRDFDPLKRLYGVNDGTAGIAGAVIQSKKSGWGKTVLKEGIQIAADAAQERMTTALGEIELGSARNAILRGTSSVAKAMIPQDTTTSQETYVSIPAGKEFYLYISQMSENQPVAQTDEMATLLRERAQLMDQIRRQIGKEAT
jgi:Bacterial conjugation TrbI-like protein